MSRNRRKLANIDTLRGVTYQQLAEWIHEDKAELSDVGMVTLLTVPDQLLPYEENHGTVFTLRDNQFQTLFVKLRELKEEQPND